MNLKIQKVDYSDNQQGLDLAFLMQSYAQDEMGGAESLSQHVMDNLASELNKLPHAFSVICYVNDKPAGLVNCFEAFSTFKCKPLVNIHDVVVIEEFRGLGLSHKMLRKVEEISKEKGCVKLTLEVLQGNHIAKKSYEKFGFSAYELDPEKGQALFWQKLID